LQKEGKNNRSYFIIYVDDGWIFAHSYEIKQILTELAEHSVVITWGKWNLLPDVKSWRTNTEMQFTFINQNFSTT
jgi:hypothetical protein